MTSEDFRRALDHFGFSQSGFAREMQRLGDPRSFPTLLRTIANWYAGKASVAPEMIVVIGLLGVIKQKPFSWTVPVKEGA